LNPAVVDRLSALKIADANRIRLRDRLDVGR